MGQTEKAAMYNALRDAGVPLDKHYRNYTEDELRPAYTRLLELQAQQEPPEETPHQPPLSKSNEPGTGDVPDEPLDPAAAAFFGYGVEVPTAGDDFPAFPTADNPYPDVEDAQPLYSGVAERDPEEFAGQRLNTNPDAAEPIRTDEQGRTWFQEEILKPAYPKPRGRRKLQYSDPGTRTVQAKTGDGFVETFEVAGDKQVMSEVRITLPSYQVGIYKDPRFPFRIHTYNGISGFDFFEVQDFYGGGELVPVEVKRMYVENVLCYDIRTTIRAIEHEARQLQLQGKI